MALAVTEPGERAVPSARSAPRRASAVSNAVLAVAIFVGTEIMLFAGLVSALLILRANSGEWPPPGQPRLPVAVTGVNTLILLASALWMWRACAASRRADALRWLGWTLLFGATFLAVQGVEWVRLIRYGLRASGGVYAGTFYALVGCHAAHVVAAVISLLVLLGRLRFRPDMSRAAANLEAYRLYWLFVVAVWPPLYVLVYLV